MAKRDPQEIKDAMLETMRLFESTEAVGELLHRRVFMTPDDAPLRNWSGLNMMAAIRQGTGDARGYKQWQKVGRQVKKGSKAIEIFAPRVVKRKDEKTGEEKPVIIGFLAVNVFRYEDTEGEAMPCFADKAPENLPLIEVAQELGLDVQYAPTPGFWRGFYRPGADEIVLCDDEEATFFHELAHAVDHRENREEFGQNKTHDEIVAEWTATVLARMYGKQFEPEIGRQYIRHQLKGEGDEEPSGNELAKELTPLIGRVEAVLMAIANAAAEKAEKQAAA